MQDAEGSRSPELDVVRELLFPRLSVEEGWDRIDAADAAQRDEERWRRIEQIAVLEDDLDK
jgi:hypothetical protein